ncbi:DUF6461 domain-containing protein [Streptosporangium sp. NBC_01755]|uniref:DUF6461 domain-containing protein n=1 Tax=unclassified Streptosporangium TaxID=2632669 RepID=UPI002DD96763|nr:MULTISPECIES: DUF6461 domain-containing protein [unclassified Streptosporangium]WSA27822.1 DUF6461 domain-containing protein [Streptosporangium sp. NBC_01810]WSD00705.1 DUF6461 domain-containing protein [Streptosporangium sp. NBC_01755]
MTTPYSLYDLVSAHEGGHGSLADFYVTWCEGVSVENVARVMGADIDTVTPCKIVGWGSGSDGSGREDGNILVGAAGTWTFLLGDYRCVGIDSVVGLSKNNGRALSIEWSVHGETILRYAANGEIATVLDITYTEDRYGGDPNALDSHMEGLRFDIIDDDVEDGVTDLRESFTSALILVERITGQKINKEWLDAVYACYVLPATVNE